MGAHQRPQVRRGLLPFLALGLLTTMCGGCGVSPAVREGFQRYRESQRIVGRAYLRDLTASNDRWLADKLRAKLLKDNSPEGIAKALKEDAELRAVTRLTYARIRDTLQAMESYAADIAVVLAKLERQREAADRLTERGVDLGKKLLKSAATGGTIP